MSFWIKGYKPDRYYILFQNSYFIWGKSKHLHEQYGSVIYNFNPVFFVNHEEFVCFCKLNALAKFLPHWSQLNLFIFMINCNL